MGLLHKGTAKVAWVATFHGEESVNALGLFSGYDSRMGKLFPGYGKACSPDRVPGYGMPVIAPQSQNEIVKIV